MTPLFFFAVLISYTVKGMSGFANALILNSILSFQVNNVDITPLDLVLSLPSNLVLAWKDRKKLNLRVCAPLAICTVLGSVPGIFLLKVGNAEVLKIVMGLLIMFIGFETGLRGRGKARPQPGLLPMIVVGLISGVASGAFGIGALIAAFVNRFAGSNGEFRGNICFVFAADSIFRMILYIATGIMTWEIVLHGLMLFPCMFAGLFLGMKLAERIGDTRARAITSVLLVLSGLSVTITNLMLLF